ncbi:hypothetical protein HZC09_00805 [Candidatus Micrarchaeota archaeon]|nr:hypothetical protein [Candidatus Micrarchaeota archaeon]
MKLESVKKLFSFFIGRGKGWIIPLLVILVLLALLIVFIQTSVFAPLVYPLI